MPRTHSLIPLRVGLTISWSFVATFLLTLFFPGLVNSLTASQWTSLQEDTSHLFWHGFDGYMKYAYPQDELRPVTCGAFTRNFKNQNDYELNDPLGDYSLTLVDSLSTLAVLASSSQSKQDRKRAFNQFQSSVQSLVELYGDGSQGSAGQGARARGFDIDSKVQVFETAIRGLGGLLSAHLFAIGELPIVDYEPAKLQKKGWGKSAPGIRWPRNFSYDGQLLRLATDLGQRLLPAFGTQTGIPYPRVNLRHGIPFYRNALQNCNEEPPEDDFGDNWQCPATPQAHDERTETCSAGAGSLVLEFTVLSRLTGDARFEKVAKRAFWSVWDRRLPTGLVGAGIDAETGEWKGSQVTGIGASIDSFYEYAAKSYILLSGTKPVARSFSNNTKEAKFQPSPISRLQDSSEGFLQVWQESQRSIRRYVYNDENVAHPYYMQVNHYNGAQAAAWLDSLSAFYPGTLALAGHVEEAETTHLLYTAIWARYSAIPERWSTISGDIEHQLPWWPGRPEFIESAWYLYRATQDPWYVHVGEMTLRDIKRRCWTKCGWAGIRDVQTGELNDRMESFFLGETVKYLHLLFDPAHPLNKLDAPWVFTTEGHPLIIPRANRVPEGRTETISARDAQSATEAPTCPAARKPLPLTVSNTAARPDLFHAASLARLHSAATVRQRDSALLQASEDNPSITLFDVQSPTNNTFYPWTLPRQLVPPNGTCAPIPVTPTWAITFPTPTSLVIQAPNTRTLQGIFMNSLAGVKLGMIQDISSSFAVGGPPPSEPDLTYRINAINNQAIGRDEQVFITKDTISNVVNDNDPNFVRMRDPVNVEIVLDVPKPAPTTPPISTGANDSITQFASLVDTMEARLVDMDPERQDALMEQLAAAGLNDGPISSAFRFLMDKVSARLAQTTSNSSPSASEPAFNRKYLHAITASGAGAAPLPNVPDAPGADPHTGAVRGDLIWTHIHLAGQLCTTPLPASVARTHQILVLQRGGCSFSDKLENIPAFPPSRDSLKLVIVVNYPDNREIQTGRQIAGGTLTQDQVENGEFLFRPLVDRSQTTSGGIPRRNPVPLVMVGGGDLIYEAFGAATAVGVKRRYTVQAQGVPIRNLHVL